MFDGPWQPPSRDRQQRRRACAGSTVHARRATRDQTLDLRARRHRGVARRCHGERPVCDTVGQGLVGRPAFQEPEDQPRRERVAAAYTVEDLEAVEAGAAMETLTRSCKRHPSR